MTPLVGSTLRSRVLSPSWGNARWVLAPLLAFLALAAWAFASPIGAGPDDDYHLASTWCANGGSEYCGPGEQQGERAIAGGFDRVACYGQRPEASASCQDGLWASWDARTSASDRGNFAGEYPPVYYATMRLLAGHDVEASALAMRLLNSALCVGLATVLAALLPAARRRTLLWAWLVTVVPLGMFLIPSNNPSGWAVTGVGTAFAALLGWFESHGRRRWVLGALYLVGVIMAAGARADAAAYVVGASLTVMIWTAMRERRWMVSAVLPVIGVLVALVFLVQAGQAGVGAAGFTSDGDVSGVGVANGDDGPQGGLALAAYNVLMVPFLWTGVWGSWGLGWLDTMLPAIVVWAAASAFVVVGFAGLGQFTWRKAVNVVGVLAVLTLLPVYVLTAGADAVGENLQPRYLLPLIVLFAAVLITEPRGRALVFTRLQTAAVLGALAVANLVSLQVNIRRYVTGVDQQGLNLDAGAEWWWSGLALGPGAVWIVGALSFAGLLATLWPVLRRVDPAP